MTNMHSFAFKSIYKKIIKYFKLLNNNKVFCNYSIFVFSNAHLYATICMEIILIDA